MSNIAKYTYQLEKSSQEIFEVLSGRLIKDIPDVELFEICRTAISYGYANAGFKSVESDELGFQIKELMQELKRSFGTLREGEPVLAIRKGVLREFGEYMGLSVAVFVHFIRQYWMNNQRLDALKEFNKPQIEAKKEPSPEEIKQAYISRINEIFSAYKAKSNLSIHECTFYFKQLWKERIIAFSPDVTQELKDQALKEVLGNIDFSKAKNLEESKKMRAHYASIQDNFDTDEKVLNYAKYLGLLKWFDMLIETDQEIDDLIKDDENS